MSKRSVDNKGWRSVVQDDVESEGLEYAFVGYDSYEWVSDEEFQKLRKKFLEARSELANYIGVDPD